jgi:hypothetical protein
LAKLTWFGGREGKPKTTLSLPRSSDIRSLFKERSERRERQFLFAAIPEAIRAVTTMENN